VPSDWPISVDHQVDCNAPDFKPSDMLNLEGSASAGTWLARSATGTSESAAPIRPPLIRSPRDLPCRLWCAKSNTSTTSANTTTAIKRDEHSEAQLQVNSLCSMSGPGIEIMHMIAKGRSRPLAQCAVTHGRILTAGRTSPAILRGSSIPEGFRLSPKNTRKPTKR
jgi:hypothetical protein